MTTARSPVGAPGSAAIVVDLGFGDAGKGLLTDYLARTLAADLCVRFNGGAQAGHNVIAPDGRHHTFAQLGAASFVPGVRTHLAAPVVVHPTALAVEAARFASKGESDVLARVSVDARALLATPVHQAANRLRELARGAARHGSCGTGVGEAVADEVARPGSGLRMGDLRDRATVARRLHELADRKIEELDDVLRAVEAEPHARRGAASEIALLRDREALDRWVEASRAVADRVAVVDETWLRSELARGRSVVFEGAQGVLLDEWAGFHPHTTYSTTTFANARAILREHGFDRPITHVGVLRTYLVRHGAGPFPTEDPSLVSLLPEPHNEEGPWQGRVRRGFPDALLARYAAVAAGGVDALALTHLDALPRVPSWRASRRYELPEGARDPELFDGDGDIVTALRPPVGQDLERQERLTIGLSAARPVLEPVAFSGGASDANEHAAMEFFAEAVGAPVRFVARGPRAIDVERVSGCD